MKKSFMKAVLGAVMAAALLTPQVNAESSGVSMYRLYNPNSGEHFYTASANERDVLKQAGWTYEGIGWTAPASGNPVYRLYNANAGDHHYTMNEGEKNALVAVGWKYEGIGWYSDPAQGAALYRQYNPNAKAGSHNYTTSKAENDALVKLGWQAEGIGWYGLKGSTAEEEKPEPTPEPAANTVTIEEDPAYVSVEANVTLKKTNATGAHAKLVIATDNGTGKVASFGIQYEENISSVYSQFPGNIVFLSENVENNAAVAGTDGKTYTYIKAAAFDTTYKLRLSWQKSDNTLHYYVNDVEIRREKTSFAAPFTMGVEGSVAHNGDTIDATFTDIKIKVGDNTDGYGLGTEADWNDTAYDFFGLDGELLDAGTNGPSEEYQNDKKTFGYNASVRVHGTANIPGTDSNGHAWDWDTCFSAVEPRTGTTGHPLSGQVVIPQDRSTD